MNECQARLGSHLILYAPHFPSKLDLFPNCIARIGRRFAALFPLKEFAIKSSGSAILLCCRRAARAAHIHSLKWASFSFYLLPTRLFLSNSSIAIKTQIACRNNGLVSLFALFLQTHIDSVS
jgi:hypothetical protein